MAPKRYWQDMTTVEVAALDTARAIAVLPIAAIEQHGPHLPLSVDADLNRGILARAVALMPDDLPVTVLPLLPIGASSEHQAFPGTLSLSAETLIRLWTDVAGSVRRAGIAKLVLFNSHGGQPPIMDIVALDLRVRHGMLVVKANWWDFGLPDGLLVQSEIDHGIHGGAIETSMMLHLQPDAVRREAVADFTPASLTLARDYKRLGPHGPAAFAWQTQDLNPTGAVGDATQATAEAGHRLVEHAAQALVELLHEVDRLPPETLKDR